jgi:hypothetical protein
MAELQVPTARATIIHCRLGSILPPGFCRALAAPAARGILGLQDGANTTLKSAALRHPEPEGTGKLGKFHRA